MIRVAWTVPARIFRPPLCGITRNLQGKIMSIKIMSLVWENYPRGGSEKLVLLALADWNNDDTGQLNPSISKIAKKTNISESQAQRIMHRLIDQGILTVIGNHNGGAPGDTRQYRINIDRLTGSMDATGRMDAGRRVAPMRETGSAGATLTLIEPLLEPLMAVQPEKTDPPVAEKKYFFEGRVGRVLQKDTVPWAKAYHTLTADDARSILQLCDDYYFGLGKPPKSMFFAYSRWLQKEHDKRAKVQQEAERDRTIIYG